MREKHESKQMDTKQAENVYCKNCGRNSLEFRKPISICTLKNKQPQTETV